MFGRRHSGSRVARQVFKVSCPSEFLSIKSGVVEERKSVTAMYHESLVCVRNGIIFGPSQHQHSGIDHKHSGKKLVCNRFYLFVFF